MGRGNGAGVKHAIKTEVGDLASGVPTDPTFLDQPIYQSPKNTSIGLAVGFADLMAVASTTINQAFKPIEVMTTVMLLYLGIGLLLSVSLNILNQRIRRGLR